MTSKINRRIHNISRFPRFIALEIIFFLPLSVDAAQITLQGNALKNRIAIPFEVVRLAASESGPEADKIKSLEEYAKNQASLECQQHQCGTLPCVKAIDQTHIRKLAQAGAGLRIPGDTIGQSRLISRDWPFSIAHEEVYEDYLESITCTDDPKDLIDTIINVTKHLQVALNPSSAFCFRELSPSKKKKSR